MPKHALKKRHTENLTGQICRGDAEQSSKRKGIGIKGDWKSKDRRVETLSVQKCR